MCRKLQKIAKNWHFFGKSAQNPRFSCILPDFMADMRQIYADPKLHKNCNFFQNPAGFQYNLYWNRPENWHICGRLACTKIDIFLRFLGKKCLFTGKFALLGRFHGRYADITRPTKLHKNWHFFGNFSSICITNGPKMGHIGWPSFARNSRAKRRT